MGCGRYPAWTATLRPFKDRPDVGVPVVFYSVPATNPDGPASPFVDRFWDARENWVPPGVGMDPTSFRPFFGNVPDGTVSPLQGSADEWESGLRYDLWQAGLYQRPNGCIMVPQQSDAPRIRQEARIDVYARPFPVVPASPCPLNGVQRVLFYFVKKGLPFKQEGYLFYDDALGSWVSVYGTPHPLTEQAAYVLTPSGSAWTLTRDGAPCTITGSGCDPFHVTATFPGTPTYAIAIGPPPTPVP